MYRAQLPFSSWNRVFIAGLMASALSTAVLAWRGRSDTGSSVAPLNAVSHWFWPEKALQRDDWSLKHTATGVAVHTGSAILWAWVYDAVRTRRRLPNMANALTDAVVVTAIASWVDLKLVPPRLTPGFERRLQPSSTIGVYTAFALGLALAGLLTNKVKA